MGSVKLNRQVLGPDQVMRGPDGPDGKGGAWDIPDELAKEYTRMGLVDDGSAGNDMVAAAHRGGTAQVIAGIDPATGQIDHRTFAPGANTVRQALPAETSVPVEIPGSREVNEAAIMAAQHTAPETHATNVGTAVTGTAGAAPAQVAGSQEAKQAAQAAADTVTKVEAGELTGTQTATGTEGGKAPGGPAPAEGDTGGDKASRAKK